jgi:cytoskeletal protein CcmA (bactofilin family)
VGCAALASAASASSPFAAGDVVVYRVGTGTGALSSAAFPVFLNEYSPSGELVESYALPTAVNGSNKPLVASGSGSSEGLLTLSANSSFLMLTGYDAATGTAKVAETLSASVPRTVARVSGSGEMDTSTALTDVANGNNVRGVASSDGTNIWVAAAGKSTTGGVHYTTLGSSTSTLMSAADTNARTATIFDGQLYTSSDPSKEGIGIATVGTGLPTTGGQTTTNLPFTTAPTGPYAFSFLTLGLGSAPDTLYVADNSAGAVLKFGLVEGKWVKQGSVAVTAITGLTANDASGIVTIYATTSGSSGEGGVLDKITDASGLDGTLSGTATQIATAPVNEAFRGVAFAPGTVTGSGGAPPPPEPTITTSEASLPAAEEDPTNPTLEVTVGGEGFEASELTVKAHSSNPSVAPEAGISVTGSGAQRTLMVTPGTVGDSTITLTVEAPGGGSASTTVNYGVSAYQGDPSDRYYSGAGNGSSAIDVGDGYMVLADDESNVLRLYHGRVSGAPVKTFDFTKVLPNGSGEIDIESSARAGDTLYWMGSLSNKKSGKADADRDIVFAATISGSGAGTELTYLGSYTHLRDDLIAWDEANGNPLGLAASAAEGVPSNVAEGLNDEGLEFAAGSTSTAYLAFRAPLEPTSARNDALLVPVTDFSSLIGDGSAGSATFGSALEWNLGGRGIREIRRNAAGEYLIIAGTPDDSNSSFGLYTWDGNTADEPVLSETPISGVAEGAWESIVSVPEPLVNGAEVELIEDNGDSVWYDDGLTSKTGMPSGLQKDLGRVFTLQLAVPSAPGTPQLSSGVTPNGSGQFELSWEAAHGTGAIAYTLQHQNAQGGWSDVAGGLSETHFVFTAGSPEAEGTWTYRVIASNEGGESEASGESSAVKVDKTPPNAPTATPDRAPDFAGDGGWYKDSVMVSFASNGDPVLSDGSAGSGVDESTLSAPEAFSTDGAHEAHGTVRDNVGNESAPGSLTVQVDATPPSVEANCPATAQVGESGVVAKVSASDGQSGLSVDPSGTKPIDTSSAGEKTVTARAVDNVGHESEASCSTDVEAGRVISGTVKGPLTIKASESVELTSTAHVTGAVKVKRGGSVDVEGATLSGGLSAKGAAVVRVCGASIAGSVKINGSTGAVVLGDVSEECAASSFFGAATVSSNTDGVRIEGQALIEENTFHGSLKVSGNGGGTIVVDNLVDGSLTVNGNGAPVTDMPNTVEGKTKVQ